jgi:uncharacterized OB-fold protein
MDALGIPAEITPETASFWAAGAAGELVVDRCTSCGLHVFPPRGVCRDCLGREFTPCPISPPGVIYSLTVNHNAWSPGSPAVYTVGLVEFPHVSSIRMVGMLEEFGDEGTAGAPGIGDLVGFRLRPAFDGRFQISFVPWTPEQERA